MATLNIKRVITLPGTLAADTLYIVRDPVAGLINITATGSDGSEVRHTFSKADAVQMFADKNLSRTGLSGTFTKITVDDAGLFVSGTTLAAADIPSLPGTKITSAISVDTSGNAATATKLATARNINGVAFDGTAPITINAVDATARVATSLLGQANGVATLDSNGTVPASQLPSYVDDVLEFADLATLQASSGAQTGKIYVTIDTGKIYRWSGSVYIEISPTAGNADSATKLATARTISLSGGATGSVSFDGTGNVSIAVTVDGTQHTHAAVTTTVAGFMSAADKVKLDGIAASANNYSLPVATAAVLGGVKDGTGVTIAADGTLSVDYGTTIGTAVQGNDARVTADQVAATASIRTLGTGALQAAAGNHNHTLDSLSNVVITSLAANDGLVWDTGTSKWINKPVSNVFMATNEW